MKKGTLFTGIGLLLFVYVVLAMLTTSCSSDNPTAPTGVIAPEPITLPGTLPSTSNDEGSGEKAEYTTSNDGEYWYVNMKNTSGWKHTFAAGCYIPGDAPVAQQKLVGDGDQAIVGDGKRHTFAAELECGELVHQCDFIDCELVPENPDYGGCMIQAKRVVSAPCDTTPKCVEKECPRGEHFDKKKCKCVPDECIQPEPPQCEHGPPIWFKEVCQWGCPPPTECPSPQPEPECESQMWVPFPVCQWAGCCPDTEPECPEQTWNNQTCEWEGECVCEPEEGPDSECPDLCEWDEELCEWDCDDCPQECETGLVSEGCYAGNVDTAAQFETYFGFPVNRIGHSDGYFTACKFASMNAAYVVVKGGPQFNLYTDVKKWDIICTCNSPMQMMLTKPPKNPDISHVSYFDCPRED